MNNSFVLFNIQLKISCLKVVFFTLKFLVSGVFLHKISCHSIFFLHLIHILIFSLA